MTGDHPDHHVESTEPAIQQAGSPVRLPLSDSDIADLLEQHHRALERLEEDIATIAESQGEVLTDVTDLRNSMGPSGDPATAMAKPSRWSWRHATDEQAAALGEELVDFVTWLTSRYLTDSPHRIPGCWDQHPVAVEEFTALMAAWQAAYCAGDKPTDRLAAWHTHHLWPVLQRLPDIASLGRCERGHVSRAPKRSARDIPSQSFRNHSAASS